VRGDAIPVLPIAFGDPVLLLPNDGCFQEAQPSLLVPWKFSDIKKPWMGEFTGALDPGVKFSYI
jgi:hypothetical protein